MDKREVVVDEPRDISPCPKIGQEDMNRNVTAFGRHSCYHHGRFCDGEDESENFAVATILYITRNLSHTQKDIRV
jgi:hypothetical protein